MFTRGLFPVVCHIALPKMWMWSQALNDQLKQNLTWPLLQCELENLLSLQRTTANIWGERGEKKLRDELPALRWFACWHDLKWSLRLPPTVHDTKHNTLSEATATSCSNCNSETISSHVDFTVDCCDLSENIWPDHKLFFALRSTWTRCLGKLSFNRYVKLLSKDISVN